MFGISQSPRKNLAKLFKIPITPNSGGKLGLSVKAPQIYNKRSKA